MQYKLIVNKGTGLGQGTVKSSETPAKIDCGPSCASAQANYGANSQATLTATPATDGSSFAGWSGACTNTIGNCVVTMGSDKTVTANFNLYKLQVYKIYGAGASGSVTVSPAGASCGTDCYSYSASTSVTLTPSAGANSAFVGWTGSCFGTSSCSLVVGGVKTASAEFTVPQYALTISGHNALAGTITSSPAGIDCGGTCWFNYNKGTSVTLTRTINSGYDFLGWTGACSGTAATCVVTMDAAKTVGTSTDTSTKNLIAQKSGTGTGTITAQGINCGSAGTDCSEDYTRGSSITLTATAAADGSTFSGWGGDCASAGTASTCTLAMTSPRFASASFAAPNTYQLTVATG